MDCHATLAMTCVFQFASFTVVCSRPYALDTRLAEKMRSGGSYFAERPLRLVEQNTVLRSAFFQKELIFLLNSSLNITEIEV